VIATFEAPNHGIMGVLVQWNTLMSAPVYKLFVSIIGPLITAFLMGINPINTIVFAKLVEYIWDFANPNNQRLAERGCLLPKVKQAMINKIPMPP
jgi:hypothetical protein